jgi:hypothetical protein
MCLAVSPLANITDYNFKSMMLENPVDESAGCTTLMAINSALLAYEDKGFHFVPSVDRQKSFENVSLKIGVNIVQTQFHLDNRLFLGDVEVNILPGLSADVLLHIIFTESLDHLLVQSVHKVSRRLVSFPRTLVAKQVRKLIRRRLDVAKN